MAAYYNEFDPFAAAWLRGLIKDGRIADGDVDERSITEVRAADLEGYTQCHFFAGIGGWSYALRLAGWPDDRAVWTGSCPCQPFSAAGKREGNDDERHLWPEFFRLIRECRAPAVFGEQVEAAIRHGWLDGISADLEGEGYAVGAHVLGAHSVGAPHIRQRLYWVAYAGGVPGFQAGISRVKGSEGVWRNQFARSGSAVSVANATCGGAVPAEQPGCGRGTVEGRTDGGMANAASSRHAGAGQGAGDDRDGADQVPQRGFAFDESAWGGSIGGMADTTGLRSAEQQREQGIGTRGESAETDAPEHPGPDALADDDSQRFSRGPESHGIEERPEQPASRRADAGGCGLTVIACRDGKYRRIPAEPALFPLADGLPGRVGLLRGAGNAIVPQLAAEFIQACEESRSEVGAV